MRNSLLAQSALIVLTLAGRLYAANTTLTLDDASLLTVPDGAGEVVVAKSPSSVDVVVLRDLPDNGKGTLWSSWGDGCVATNGKFYYGVGDHIDFHAGKGDARLYEYDPATKANKLVLNVRDLIPSLDRPAGKIHSRVQQGADGGIYFATYWGKDPFKPGKGAEASKFVGSPLIRFDPATGKSVEVGIPVAEQGLPASTLDAKRNIFYAFAVRSDDLIAYDFAKRELKFRGGGDKMSGHRSIMLDNDGNAYFSQTEGVIGRYSPETNAITATRARLPDSGDTEAAKKGGSLRAATRAAKNGTIYGFTASGLMFAFEPQAESIKSLGVSYGGGMYTAVAVLSPDDKYVYYAPGAHGSGARVGTPVVQYDIASGKHKVLAYLNPVLREKLDYNTGGTYCMDISGDGATLFVVFNGADLKTAKKKDETFGKPSLIVVNIPKGER